MSSQKTAGFKAKVRGPGRPAKDRPSKDELQRFYVNESRSIRDIANILNCSKDVVYRSLREYEIGRKKHSEKRSRLQDYELSYLKREIRQKGQVQVAKEIGINQSTLSRYMSKKN